jgi:hypothetical protein
MERSTSLTVRAPMRSALNRYLECLSAWAEGAGLSQFDHHKLADFAAAHQPISPQDLALLLQHDNTGCSTGLYRVEDGSILLWHTEEDTEQMPGSRFDQLRVVSFRVGDEDGASVANAFVYPALLPGPAFAWRSDGFVQAVDSLILKPTPLSGAGTLANIAVWLALWLGPTVDTEEDLRSLGPFYDGYALNIVQLSDRQLHAHKYEFAEARVVSHQLAEQPGSHLLQVNVFSNGDDEYLRSLEGISSRRRHPFEQRLRRMRRLLFDQEQRGRLLLDPLDALCNMLTSRAGGGWAYANNDVKAYFVCRVSCAGIDLRLGPGSALRGDRAEVIHVSDRQSTSGQATRHQ